MVFFGNSNKFDRSVPEKSASEIKKLKVGVDRKIEESESLHQSFAVIKASNARPYKETKQELAQLKSHVFSHIESSKKLKDELSSTVTTLAKKVQECSSRIESLNSKIKNLEGKKNALVEQKKALEDKLPSRLATFFREQSPKEKVLQERYDTLKENIKSKEALLVDAGKEIEGIQKEKKSFEATQENLKAKQANFEDTFTQLHSLEENIKLYERTLSPITGLNEDDKVRLIKELAFRIFYSELAVPQVISDQLCGNSRGSSLHKMISDLKTKDSEGQLVFEKIMGKENYSKCLTKLEEFTSTTDLVRQYNGQEHILNSVKKPFTDLKIGESKLYPGGYLGASDNQPGHSVLYEFKRVGENNYELSLYNTGEGSSIFGPRKATYSFTKDKIEDKEFWKGLLSFETQSTRSVKADTTYSQHNARSMSDVYNFLEKKLGPAKSGDRLEAQTWGNCTYMTLKAWVTSALNSSQKEEFHTKIRELAADELSDALPHLTERDKKNIFGNEVISHLERKVDVIKNTDTSILGRIKRIWYYVSVSISNFFSILKANPFA